MIRVLIVEDSAFAAEILSGILQSDPDIQVIGVAQNGMEAVEMTPRLKPDLITMDVWMPQMDGFATVEQVMAYHPTPILVVTTSLARTDVDISLTMLAAGALDVIEKPSRLGATSWEQQTRALIRKVKLLARVRVVTHLRGRRGLRAPSVVPPLLAPPPAAAPFPAAPAAPNGDKTPAPEVPLGYALRMEIGQPAAPPPAPERPAPSPRSTPAPPVPRRGGSETATPARRATPAPPALVLPPHLPGSPGVNRYTLLAIASSTGGPQALLTLLRALPATFPLPIVVVQHIAAGFTQGLADWLARECRRPVACAADGDKPKPGAVLLAPDAHHLLLGADGRVRLATSERPTICPAADVTMQSVAEIYEARAIGVILTGMGRDGAEGMKAMRLAGGYTIAQDEQSSIIFGMPRAAISLGIIDEVLPLDQIAPRLEQLVAGRAP
jgi:two-component system chemotaxis response regulator CheB